MYARVCTLSVYIPAHSVGCVKTMHIERTMLNLDEGVTLPGIVRCFEVQSQSRRTVVLSPIEVAVDMLRRKNADLQSLIRRYTDMLGREIPVVQHSLNPLTMALKGVVDPAVMGGIVKYQEVSCCSLSGPIIMLQQQNNIAAVEIAKI